MVTPNCKQARRPITNRTISVSFWISMHAGSWVTEYLVTPVPTWLLPHFEMLIRNAASRKILHFIVIEESSTHLLLLRCFFKRMESNSLFLLLAAHMTTQLLKPFLQHSKKKRHTAESIPQSKAFSKALSNIFDSIMKFVRTKHSNTRRRRLLRRSIMQVLSKTGVQIASWSENNTFPFGDF